MGKTRAPGALFSSRPALGGGLPGRAGTEVDQRPRLALQAARIVAAAGIGTDIAIGAPADDPAADVPAHQDFVDVARRGRQADGTAGDGGTGQQQAGQGGGTDDGLAHAVVSRQG